MNILGEYVPKLTLLGYLLAAVGLVGAVWLVSVTYIIVGTPA